MQELTIAPQSVSPYTPAGGGNMQANAPTLGTPIPGMQGGLPAKPGLSVYSNPLPQAFQSQTNNPQAQQAAQHTQSFGRGQDSMLVHMTPEEVNSLRGLAQRFGGDLTMNPNTGLPEAGWLGKLLPTILGAAGMLIPGAAPWMIAAGVGAGQTALTGDLGKGLMAGLQAFGGASLAGAAGVGGGAGTTLTPTAETAGGVVAPAAPVGAASAALPPPVAEGLTGMPGLQLPGMSANIGGATLAAQVPGMAPAALAPTTAAIAPPAGATPGFFSRFGAAAREGIKPGMLSKYAPMAAGLGSLSAVSDVTAPNLRKYDPEEDKWKYEGPYMPVQRRLRPRVEGEGEISFFDNPNPYPGFLTRTGDIPTGYAEGGDVDDTAEARSKYLNTFDERLKSMGNLSEAQQRVADQLRTQISDPMGAVESATGRAARMSLPQLHNVASSVMLQLGSLGGLANQVPTSGRQLTLEGVGTTPPPVTSPPVTQPPVTQPPVTQPPVTQPSSPGATASGYGVEVLPGRYTPQFTQKADFVTAPVTPYTGGTEALARLGELTKGFQTSPGAITASRTYTGGSPSQRIREAAKANAAQGEIDYGVRMPTTGADAGTGTGPGINPYVNPGFTGDFFNQFWSSYFNPNTGSRDRYMNDSIRMNAKGGSIHMDDGAFVVDARTVSELGNGSSSAGQELLARLGGRPVKGPGDGVSDSIPANIGGTQEARVARDEVIIPAAAVRKLGGAKKLYALMEKAHKARKKAKRGEDTKVAKGLGALA